MDIETVMPGHRPDAPPSAPEETEYPGMAEAALAAVTAAINALTAVDLTVPGTGAVLDLLRGIETQTRRLYGVSVAVIGQMQHRGLAAPAGQTSTASLVRQVITIGRGDAAARVRLAAAVCPTIGLSGASVPANLSLLAAAVTAGAIGAKQADLITWVFKTFTPSVGAQLRDSVEEFLIDEAAGLDPVTFENVCRKIVLMADPDGPDEEKDAHERQEFHIGSRRPNGLTKVWGLLDDLTVEALRAAFGAMGAPAAQRSKHATPEDRPAPGPPPVDATLEEAEPRDPRPGDDLDSGGPPNQAVIDLLIDADPPDHPPPDTDPPDHPPPPSTDLAPVYHPQRLPYDWVPLGTVASDYINDPPDPPGAPSAPKGNDQPPLTPRLFGDDPGPHDPTGQSEAPGQLDPNGIPPAATRRAQALTVMISHFLAHGSAPTQGGEKPHLIVTVDEKSLRDRIGHGTLGYGTHIPIDTIRMIACNSHIIAAVLGSASQPLDIGRAARTFNAATTRALLLRDKGCIFPGCDTPGQWPENHHIKHWANGGNSDYNNGCLLCRRHHTLIHHSDWQIRIAPDGTPELIPPATHDPTQTPQRNTLHHPPTFAWPQRA